MQKSHHVIRNDINYLDLSVYEFNGIRFVAQTSAASNLRLEPIEVDEIPEFVTHLRVDISVKHELSGWDTVYVLDKKDIRPLCKMYSSVMGNRIRVLGAARILGEWLPSGEVAGSFRNLDYFYVNISQTELEEYSF